jgi:regulatory LuxR family protein
VVPDIAIIDISMPGLTGLEILAIANSEKLSTRLVFFTSVEDRELVISAAAGPYGVILGLIRGGSGNNLWPPARLTATTAPGFRAPHPSVTPGAKEGREYGERPVGADGPGAPDHAPGVRRGCRTKEIGRRLDIVDGTIKVHLHNIFQTLEIGNRTILAKLAISHNDSMGVPKTKLTGFATVNQGS